MSSNLVKQISSGISVFGWYTKFDDAGEAHVHVDINFDVAKFGGAAADKVQFELEFSRVEVIVFCGDGVAPIRSSIARVLNVRDYEVRVVEELKSEGSVGAAFAASTSKAPSFEANASGAISKTQTKTSERTEVASTVVIRHGMHGNRHPYWQIRESSGAALSGAPWDPVNEPRFKFTFVESKIDPDPNLRVVLKCRTEDLIIKNIKIKSEEKNLLSLKTKSPTANRIAAEQFLRDLILKEGLPMPVLEQAFGEVTVADVVLTLE